MDGTQHDDVVIIKTPVINYDESDEYGVQLGARILEQVMSLLRNLPYSEVCRDDAWASVNVGAAPEVSASIVWVNETDDNFIWAIQFSESRGSLVLPFKQHTMSASERDVRNAVYVAAQHAFGLSNVAWISDAEFRRIY